MAVRTQTLTPGNVTRLTAPGQTSHVGVFNIAGPADVYATINGVDPVANADDVYVIPSGTRRELHYQSRNDRDVRLLSTGAVKVEVEWAP